MWRLVCGCLTSAAHGAIHSLSGIGAPGRRFRPMTPWTGPDLGILRPREEEGAMGTNGGRQYSRLRAKCPFRCSREHGPAAGTGGAPHQGVPRQPIGQYASQHNAL
mmetsp:Transcript_30469/g.51465  ORF Transcript_30469/g.51465 Transcript_30469/m.51465 type:complete len:106 (-) Transcript_30469:418-735(-)